MRRKYERLNKVVLEMQKLARCVIAAHYYQLNVAIVASARKVGGVLFGWCGPVQPVVLSYCRSFCVWRVRLKMLGESGGAVKNGVFSSLKWFESARCKLPFGCGE